MTAYLYVEGGGDRPELKSRCREGFSNLLLACGFAGRMPRIVACGARTSAYDDFVTSHRSAAPGTYVALLVDSEEPVANINDPWAHLLLRDGWPRPTSARDEQAFLMVTSMETWIACDRVALATHYRSSLHPAALLPIANIEARPHAAVFQSLVRATRAAARPYAKGAESFTLLTRLDPQTLVQYLPSFARTVAVLQQEL